MKRVIYKRIATVLGAAAVAAVLAASGLASAGVSRDRYYDGEPTSTNGEISLALDLQVSGGGHQVRRLSVTYVDFTCLGNTDANLLLPGDRTAPITTGDKFTVKLPSKDSSSSQANGSAVLSGSFGDAGTVSGKLVFTGSGPLAGCHRTIHWKGQARPLVDYFTGRVTQGSHDAAISFYRAIKPHDQVTDFTVGVLTATCPGGASAQVSLKSGSSLTVRPDAKFDSDVFFTTGDAGNIGGKFQGATHATGTVSYAGRDDCSYDLSWSAHRVATNVLGPFNFGQ